MRGGYYSSLSRGCACAAIIFTISGKWLILCGIIEQIYLIIIFDRKFIDYFLCKMINNCSIDRSFSRLEGSRCWIWKQ